MNWKTLIFGPGIDNANVVSGDGDALDGPTETASRWREMIFGPGAGDANVTETLATARSSWQEKIFGPGSSSGTGAAGSPAKE